MNEGTASRDGNDAESDAIFRVTLLARYRWCTGTPSRAIGGRSPTTFTGRGELTLPSSTLRRVVRHLGTATDIFQARTFSFDLTR